MTHLDGGPVPEPVESAPPSMRHGKRWGFRALAWPGYRIYFVGLVTRGIAVWVQLVSIPLLAIGLGATPVELGFVTALLFLPTLFIGALGGVLADRVDRGHALLVTQSGSALLSIALWALISTDSATLVWVAAMALIFGLLTAVEMPLRQSYLTELVPLGDITSAASLHATGWNTTRFVGPVVAGVLIATIGMAATFLVAALLAVAVASSIPWMNRYRISGRRPQRTGSGVLEDLREGAAFAMSEVTVRWSLILAGAVGVLGIQAFQTLAPLYGAEELGLKPGAYGLFLGLWGAGAVTSAVVVTAVARGDRRKWLIAGTLSLATFLAGVAIVDVIWLAYAFAFALGFSQIALIQNAMISVQSVTPDAVRGRVMGIWVTVFQGSAPFGAILAGVFAELVGVRGAMLLGALALGVVGLVAAVVLPRVAWRGPRAGVARTTA
jgi:MFS family permease